MTRKKWNRLKRQRPDLFVQAGFNNITSGWETVKELPEIRYMSKLQAVKYLTARLTYARIAQSGEEHGQQRATVNPLVGAPKPYVGPL